MNIFIIEDMREAREALAAELWRRHPLVSIFCGGTPATAEGMLGKYWRPGDIIVLDRDDGEGGSFHDFVPKGAWPRVISISVNASGNEVAFFKRAAAIIPKDYKDLGGWGKMVVDAIEKVIDGKNGGRSLISGQ
jgi:hypothetical protein